MISNIDTVGESQEDFAEEQKRKAMTLFLDTWDEGCVQGIASELLSEVCLYLALTDLVEEHGEDDVADIIETLPYRIRNGEFSLKLESH